MGTVLITGASRGIGAEMARQALARGDAVIACARRPETAPEGTEGHALDVADPASHARLAEALAGRRIDLVVCNAGVLLGRGRLGDPFPAEAWAETFAVNVTGVFLTVEALRENLGPGSKIAVISSRMGSSAIAPGGGYIYRASKAAATNLVRNLAVDLAPAGIAVGAYHPGWVRTDMGGASADVDVRDSAAGLLARFEALSVETAGVFETWDGAAIPF